MTWSDVVIGLLASVVVCVSFYFAPNAIREHLHSSKHLVQARCDKCTR